MTSNEPVLKELLTTIPQKGLISWIGLRPNTSTPMEVVDHAIIEVDQGLVGDRYQSKNQTKRQVTLIQEEHLATVGSILGQEIDPALLRRNIMVSGINLLALHNQKIKIGEVIIEGTGFCYPCSKMEKNLGPGGYNAMRGHGGITARVIKGGSISIGDRVTLYQES